MTFWKHNVATKFNNSTLLTEDLKKDVITNSITMIFK